jgi:hypothetical protein
LLLLAGAGGQGALYLMKKKNETAVVGVPGIGCSSVGALLPTASIVPERYRGQCSPLWFDAGVWGAVGAAVGYYGLAGKKLF